MEIKKPDKKSLQYLGIIIIIAIIVSTGLIYYLKKTGLKEAPEKEKPAEKTMEEILESLGTSGKEGREIPEDVLESLGVPGEEGRKVPGEVLESLGTPE